MMRTDGRSTKLIALVLLLPGGLLCSAQISDAQGTLPSQVQGLAAGPIATGAAQSAGTRSNPLLRRRVPLRERISPKQAEELFRSVDEILAFDSKDTGCRSRTR